MSTAASAKPIIVGVDDSEPAKAAIDWAARDAARRAASLVLVNVVIPPAVMAFAEVPVPPGYLDWQDDNARNLLERSQLIAKEAAEGAQLDVTTQTAGGSAVLALTDLSEQAQMVVVGSHGRGALARGLLGSISTGLIHHAHCPVAVIRDQDPQMPHPSHGSVVVGVDGSPASERALAIAFEQASFRGVDLVAVHAWSDSRVFEFPGVDWVTMQARGEETLSERLSGWSERYPDVLVRRVVTPDKPAHQLLEQAKSAQLLVVGSHGRGGFAGMVLGSVSTSIIHNARLPVIVARSGHRS